jgi:hypothetical protein
MDREQQREAARAAAASKKSPIKVPVSAWGGEIYIRPASWSVMSRIRRQYPNDDPEQGQARIAASAICDEAGNLTFDPNNEEDVSLIADQGMEFVAAVGAAITQSEGKASAQSTNS